MPSILGSQRRDAGSYEKQLLSALPYGSMLWTKSSQAGPSLIWNVNLQIHN